MKRIILITLALVMLGTMAFGASLNLRATWTANTEPDMREYRLYRTDVTRTLIGTIPHPSTVYNFSITVPDGSSKTMTFVLVAVDTNNNVSGDSLPAPFFYNLDVTPPASPSGLSIQVQ